MENGRIIHIDGAKQYQIHGWNPGNKNFRASNKLVECTHPNNTGQFDRGPLCGKYLLVRYFQEISL